jgi:hypothetical protein
MWILVMVKPNVVFKYYIYSHFTQVQTITDYKLKVLLCHSHRNSQSIFEFYVTLSYSVKKTLTKSVTMGTHKDEKKEKLSK